MPIRSVEGSEILLSCEAFKLLGNSVWLNVFDAAINDRQYIAVKTIALRFLVLNFTVQR